MKIYPLNKNILIQVETQESVLAPEPIDTDFGVVLAIGGEVTKVKEGDKLAFMKWGLKKVGEVPNQFVTIAEDSPWLIGIVKND